MSMWFVIYSYDWKKCILFKTTCYYTFQILHSRCLLILLISLHHSRAVSLFYLWLQRSSPEKKKKKGGGNSHIFTGNIKGVFLNYFLKILFNFFSYEGSFWIESLRFMSLILRPVQAHLHIFPLWVTHCSFEWPFSPHQSEWPSANFRMSGCPGYHTAGLCTVFDKLLCACTSI